MAITKTLVRLRHMTVADFDAVLDVHLRGAFHVVRAAFPVLCDAGYGRIVLTSSIGGLYGNRDVANYAAAKAGVIGLSNVAGLAGARRRRALQRRRAAGGDAGGRGHRHLRLPADGARLVAPVVGWLAHESCSVTGEVLIALAGRIARAVVAESPGVYQPSWTVEGVAERIEEIRDVSAPVLFPVVPGGHGDHIRYSFGMAHADREGEL